MPQILFTNSYSRLAKLSFRRLNLSIDLLSLSHNIGSQVPQLRQRRLKSPDIWLWIQCIVAGTEGRGGDVGGTEALDEFIDDEFVAECVELQELAGGWVEAVYVGRPGHASL